MRRGRQVVGRDSQSFPGHFFHLTTLPSRDFSSSQTLKEEDKEAVEGGREGGKVRAAKGSGNWHTLCHPASLLWITLLFLLVWLMFDYMGNHIIRSSFQSASAATWVNNSIFSLWWEAIFLKKATWHIGSCWLHFSKCVFRLAQSNEFLFRRDSNLPPTLL